MISYEINDLNLGQNSIVYVPGATNLLKPEEILAREKTIFKDCQLFVTAFECIPQTLHQALSIARKQGGMQ
jgi:sugar/nucleoside kinase (ribokinase family)